MQNDHFYDVLTHLSHNRSATNERLPKMAIKVPDWVKFHQSWLSIVHGNQPCQLQDAITVSTLIYIMILLDLEIKNYVRIKSLLNSTPSKSSSVHIHNYS